MEIVWFLLSIIGFIAGMILLCIIQNKVLTEEERNDMADAMDEFIYGEK